MKYKQFKLRKRKPRGEELKNIPNAFKHPNLKNDYNTLGVGMSISGSQRHSNHVVYSKWGIIFNGSFCTPIYISKNSHKKSNK